MATGDYKISPYTGPAGTSDDEPVYHPGQDNIYCANITYGMYCTGTETHNPVSQTCPSQPHRAMAPVGQSTYRLSRYGDFKDDTNCASQPHRAMAPLGESRYRLSQYGDFEDDTNTHYYDNQCSQERVSVVNCALMSIKKMAEEITNFKQLQHENILLYLKGDMCWDSGELNITTAWISNVTLSQLIPLKGCKPDVCNVTKQILHGLTYLHNNDIIQGSLHPKNILVYNQQNIKLFNFGTYRLIVDSSRMTVNTDADIYIAPEVVITHNLSVDQIFPESDIWSLGCLVIEMTTAGKPQLHKIQKVTIASGFGDNVSIKFPRSTMPRVMAFAAKCMQMNPTERPATVELLHDPLLQTTEIFTSDRPKSIPRCESEWTLSPNKGETDRAGLPRRDTLPSLHGDVLDIREQSVAGLQKQRSMYSATDNTPLQSVLLNHSCTQGKSILRPVSSRAGQERAKKVQVASQKKEEETRKHVLTLPAPHKDGLRYRTNTETCQDSQEQIFLLSPKRQNTCADPASANGTPAPFHPDRVGTSQELYDSGSRFLPIDNSTNCCLDNCTYIAEELVLNKQSTGETSNRTFNDTLNDSHIQNSKSCVAMQRTIPEAIANNKLIDLVVLANTNLDGHVRFQALKALEKYFYSFVSLSDPSNYELFLHVEKLLSLGVTEGIPDGVRLRTRRLHVYCLVLSAIYIQWLTLQEAQPILLNIDKMDDLLKTLKLKKRTLDFIILHEFLKKFRDRLVRKRKSDDISKARDLLTSASHFYKTVTDGSCKDDSESAEQALLSHFTNIKWFEAHICIHLLINLVCAQKIQPLHLVKVFKKLVSDMRETEKLSRPIQILSIVHAYVRLLNRLSDPGVNNLLGKESFGVSGLRKPCSEKSRDVTGILKKRSTKKSLGDQKFSEFLKYAQTKIGTKGALSDALSLLFFHTHADVTKLAIQHRFVVAEEECLGSDTVRSLSIEHRDLIAATLEPFGYQLKDEEIGCSQCDYNGHEFHRSWDGRFGDISVALLIANTDHNLLKSRSSHLHINELANDITILEYLTSSGGHPNLASLIVYQEKVEPVFYIIENMGQPLGSYLLVTRNMRPLLPIKDLMCNVVLPLLSIVKFCHERKILLCNITSNSLMATAVGNSLRVKLNCFHMAKRAEPDRTSNLIAHGNKDDLIPLLYSAPEVILQCLHTEYSDIHMVGHTVLEILSRGLPPYSELNWKSETIVIEVLKHGIKPKKVACVPDRIYSAVNLCLLTVPDNRLSLETLEEEVIASIETFNCKRFTDGSIKEAREESAPENYRPVYGIPETLKDISKIDDLRIEVDQPNEENPYYIEFQNFKCQQEELHASDDPEFIDDDKYGKRYFDLLTPVTWRQLIVCVEVWKSVVLRQIRGAHLHTLHELDHNHVVNVVAFIPTTKALYTTMPTCEGQSLLELAILSRPPPDSQSILQSQLLNYFIQIADGMSYLHSKGLIHCCLQAQFVYMDLTCEQVQIGHLGRTTLVQAGPYDETADSTTMMPFQDLNQNDLRNMLRYSPIEANDGFYSMKSDVASFAHLIYEVFEARNAHPATLHTDIVPYAHATAEEVLIQQRRRQTLPQPNGCSNWLYRLIKKATLDPPYRRPLFPEIRRCLTSSQPEKDILLTDAMPHQSNQLKRKFDPEDFDDKIRKHYERGTIRYREQNGLENCKKMYDSREDAILDPWSENGLTTFIQVEEKSEGNLYESLRPAAKNVSSVGDYDDTWVKKPKENSNAVDETDLSVTYPFEYDDNLVSKTPMLQEPCDTVSNEKESDELYRGVSGETRHTSGSGYHSQNIYIQTSKSVNVSSVGDYDDTWVKKPKENSVDKTDLSDKYQTPGANHVSSVFVENPKTTANAVDKIDCSVTSPFENDYNIVSKTPTLQQPYNAVSKEEELDELYRGVSGESCHTSGNGYHSQNISIQTSKSVDESDRSGNETASQSSSTQLVMDASSCVRSRFGSITSSASRCNGNTRNMETASQASSNQSVMNHCGSYCVCSQCGSVTSSASPCNKATRNPETASQTSSNQSVMNPCGSYCSCSRCGSITSAKRSIHGANSVITSSDCQQCEDIDDDYETIYSGPMFTI